MTVMAFAFPYSMPTGVFVVLVAPILMVVTSAAWMWRVDNLYVAPTPLLAGLIVQLISALWMQVAIYAPCGSLPESAQPNCIAMPGNWGIMFARIDAYGMNALFATALAGACAGYFLGAVARQMHYNAHTMYGTHCN